MRKMKVNENELKRIEETDAFSKNAFERECDDDEIVTLLEGKWRID